jgi:hypothetical protein
MRAEIHAVILWSNALPQRDRLVADLAEHVELVASYRVEWPPERFSENLVRLYGFQLPERMDKVAGGGDQPFLLFVVRDPNPRYGARPRSWGLGPANTTMHDAKQRYRDWTGGGFRVHATIDAGEADRDLFLLLGRRSSEFADAPTIDWESEPEPLAAEVVGAAGWESTDQLVNALDVACDYVMLAEQPLELLVGDQARAEQLLSSGDGVELHEEGDGDLHPGWQRALLRERVWDADGRWIPTPQHRAMTSLHRALRDPAGPTLTLEVALDDEARETLPQGDIADPVYARALLDDFLRRNGWAPERRRTPRSVALARKIRRRLRRGR